MLIKAMILILMAAFAGLFFVTGPGGEAVLTLEDFKPEPAEMDAGQAPTKVYRWQDENGIWQFSNQPEDETQGELLELDGKINTMPAVDASILNQKQVASKQSTMSVPSGFTTVSNDKVEEMMDAVNELQSTVDSRKAEIDKLSSGNH
jgi:hypothetical protein